MSPTLDSIGSVKGYGWGSFIEIPTPFQSIATVTVGSGGSSSIEFTSIPNTYAHLQIRGIDQGDTGSDNGYTRIRFNSDAQSNYTRHQLYGTGTGATAYAETTQDRAQIVASSLNASYFAGLIIDILDYANTNKYKTIRVLSGVDENNTAGQIIMLSSSVWQSNSAITSITFLPSTQFKQYTTYALYGIKNT